MKKSTLLITTLLTTTILLTGCCLSHEFTEATCTELSTCSKCGETQGELLPHTFTEATCTESKTCSKCGETEGEPLPHTFTEATCTEPKTCSVCGHIEGETLPHKFTEATCTQPSKCEDCGHKEGEALEHQWKASELVPLDKCELCGKLSGTLSFDEMEKIVKKTDEKLYQALAEELGLSLSEIEAIAEKKDTNNTEEVRAFANGGSNGGGGSTPVATPETNQSAADENSFVTPETSGSSTGLRPGETSPDMESLMSGGDGGELIYDPNFEFNP